MILRSNQNFRRLWLGQVVSVVGDGMQRLTVLWWAAGRSSAWGLTAVALCAIVPLVVGSPLGGWLADRHDRRRLMVVADLSRCALTVWAALLIVDGSASLALVCVPLVLSALATAVFDPAYAASVPTVVSDEALPAANGLNMANSAVGGLAGPLLAGLLLGHTSAGWVLAINAASFAWSAMWIASARIPHPFRQCDPAVPAGPSIVDRFRAVEGLGRLVALAAVLNLIVAPVPLLLVALARYELSAGPGALAWLQASISAGLLVGSLAAPVLCRGPLPLPMVVLGIALAALGVLPLAGVAAALVVAGLAVAVANTMIMTTFQRRIPPDVQGRAFGVIGSLAEGLRPAGVALAGPLLALAGVGVSFALCGVGVAVAAVTWGRSVGLVSEAQDRVAVMTSSG